jgi:hypothetical protein
LLHGDVNPHMAQKNSWLLFSAVIPLYMYLETLLIGSWRANGDEKIKVEKINENKRSNFKHKLKTWNIL